MSARLQLLETLRWRRLQGEDVHLVPVGPDHAELVLAALVFLLLLDGRDDPPAGAPRTDHILAGRVGEEKEEKEAEVWRRRWREECVKQSWKKSKSN